MMNEAVLTRYLCKLEFKFQTGPDIYFPSAGAISSKYLKIESTYRFENAVIKKPGTILKKMGKLS